MPDQPYSKFVTEYLEYVVMLSHKHCAWCHDYLPATEFYRCVTNKSGLSSYCKPCHSEYARLRYRDEPLYREDAKQRAADWRAEHPEEHKENCQSYKNENREHVQEVDRKYHAENRETRNEYGRKYHAENREDRNAKRKARYHMNKEQQRWAMTYPSP